MALFAAIILVLLALSGRTMLLIKTCSRKWGSRDTAALCALSGALATVAILLSRR